MSLRARIAMLVAATVLVAIAVAGLGTTLSSRNVGRDRLDQELMNDASRFQAEGTQLATQLQLAFGVRKAT